MSFDFDVAIIGARIAGSALAKLLSDQGYKVCLIDQQKKLGPTLSTHFVNPRGFTYLNHLGVAQNIAQHTFLGEFLDIHIDNFSLGAVINKEELNKKLELVHKNKFNITNNYCAPRRDFLDNILLEASIKSGAVFFGGHKLLEISANNLVIQDTNQCKKNIRAKRIIGADGRNSTVANLLKLKKIEEHHTSTFACYSYFSGLKINNIIIKKYNRMSFAVAPTNNNLCMVLVFGPKEFYNLFSQNVSQNFLKSLKYIDKLFAQKFIDESRQEEPFYRCPGQSSFIRTPGHHVLIGDAHSFKDQCTASGITHALRDAFLLAENFDNRKKFEQERYLDSYKYYAFTSQQAQMNPVRSEEWALFDMISNNQDLRSLFVSIYCDISSPGKIFGAKIKEKLISRAAQNFRINNFKFSFNNYENIFDNKKEPSGLLTNISDFSTEVGSSLTERCENYFNWYQKSQNNGFFEYERRLKKFPHTTTEVLDESGRLVHGINFASQDYLSLGSHFRIKEVALDILDKFGPHSAGSPMIMGNTLATKELEYKLKKLCQKKHILLFPTGYMAGIGSILGLIHKHDHIVMDRFSHACLQQGARAATSKICFYNHLDYEAAEAILKKIRQRDKLNSILLVTESLFSMDADSPDLEKFSHIAKKYQASLFVDVAHDLGACGYQGGGIMSMQNMNKNINNNINKLEIDIIMGSFSKTFATNGGFVASDSEALIRYLKMYSTPHFFSNALSPLQTGIALAAAQIIMSQEGDELRNKLDKNILYLRKKLSEQNLTLLGNPSPIVPVFIGSEAKARKLHKILSKNNLCITVIEYPVAPIGSSRIRLQVMAKHEKKYIEQAAKIIGKCFREV